DHAPGPRPRRCRRARTSAWMRSENTVPTPFPLIAAVVAALLVTGTPASATKRSCLRACASRLASCRSAAKQVVRELQADCKGKARRERRRCLRAAQKSGKDVRRACNAARKDCRTCCRNGTAESCTAPCGDGMLAPDRGEQCDPPGRPCANGRTCDTHCRCTDAPGLCANGTADPGEECGEPMLAPCAASAPCLDCRCGVLVPALLGLNLEEADVELAHVGLVHGTITPVSSLTVPFGIVDQSPAAGSFLPPGGMVALTVSLPPDPNHFLTFQGHVVETDASAAAYYEAIDPGHEKTTAADWKTANGFGQPGGLETSAIYENHNDLGFGRKMFMRFGNDVIAYYVENYPTVDDAARSPAAILATVAMEYSPPPDGGAPFIKFYTFDHDGNRITKIDLDGRGEKLQPEMCTVCHGGRTKPPGEDGVYPDRGDIGARFIPFDIDSFRYSTDPGLDRASQEARFHDLNKGVI